MSSESFRSQRITAVAPSARISTHRERRLETQGKPTQPSAGEVSMQQPPRDFAGHRTRPIRMLRLGQVIAATGLGKTKIYELQSEGQFPMRVKLTTHSVAWVEEDVQAWLARRIEANTPPPTT